MIDDFTKYLDLYADELSYTPNDDKKFDHLNALIQLTGRMKAQNA